MREETEAYYRARRQEWQDEQARRRGAEGASYSHDHTGYPHHNGHYYIAAESFAQGEQTIDYAREADLRVFFPIGHSFALVEPVEDPWVTKKEA
jgi:hypothetical protein